VSIEVAFDTDVWVGVPREWSDQTWTDPADWAREAAEAVCGPDLDRGDGLAAALAMVAASPLLDPALGQSCYVHLPSPDDDPLPVWVQVLEAEGGLRELAQADEEAVEPPVVEAFTTDALGEGLRVLRYSLAAEDLLLVGLHYAHRVGDLDVHVWTSSLTPARVLAALDDVDELVRGIEVTER
jgi:hypothetical protein